MNANMTEIYKGTFYDLETENGIVKTNLRESPKLEMQDGYVKSEFTQDEVANDLSDLLIEGIITEQLFLHFINRYPK